MTSQPSIFEDFRMTVAEAIEMTVASLTEYGARHDVWVFAFSGGKDSTTLLTLTVHLIETGRVPKPRRMVVMYADTRMELPPLWLSAKAVMDDVARRDWIECRTVMAELDQRFFVYMLGRGVPPPNNNTLRWCTAQIKVEPMEAELRRLAAEVAGDDLPEQTTPPAASRTSDVRNRHSAERGSLVDSLGHDTRSEDRGRGGLRRSHCLVPGAKGSHEDRIVPGNVHSLKPLMLIGVRLGESAVRDARIAVACNRNGAECGQGWYQRDLPDAVCDKLSPILHWRVCMVWDWLANAIGEKGGPMRHAFPTRLVAWAYGAAADDHPEEVGARTGCIGCPLAEKETALDNLLTSYAVEWGHLAPLKELRPIYRELREPRNRLRQPPGEARKDGSLISNQNRMGPLTMAARRRALRGILAIQRRCNRAADRAGRPRVDILNVTEARRIRELWRMNQWPNGWTGEEPIADELYEDQYADGTRQLLLPVLNDLRLPNGGDT